MSKALFLYSARREAISECRRVSQGAIHRRPLSLRSLPSKSFKTRDGLHPQKSMKITFTCQFCGVRGGRIEADHIKWWSEYPKLRYKVSNGRTLCRACHLTTLKKSK